MKKPLETLGGLVILAGVAGFVHRLIGWAPFGVVARLTRATPFIRDHEVVTYAVLIALGLAILVVADKAEDGERPREDTEADRRDG
jgi:hypothetical protein